MQRNKKLAFEWVLKDEHLSSLPGLTAVWNVLCCDDLVDGLDYFMLDTAVACSSVNAARWLELLAHNPIVNVTYEGAVEHANALGAETVISGLELYRRRRLKVDPEWQRYGVEWSNRCTRAKKRALKMVEQAELSALALSATA